MSIIYGMTIPYNEKKGVEYNSKVTSFAKVSYTSSKSSGRISLQLNQAYSNRCDALRNLVSLVQFKKREHTRGGVLLLVKLQALACNFTKSDTPQCLFFSLLNLYKWYQIAQCMTGTHDRKCMFDAEVYPEPS